MSDLTIKAIKRKELGRKVKRLRKEGLLPANIYGKKVKSQAISVKLQDFEKLFSKAGETSVVELVVDGKIRPTLIHDMQKDPLTELPIHVDFLQVDFKEKVTAQIPVELAGESPAEKQGLGTVVQYVDEVEVEALPGNLPESFEINVSILKEVDDQIQVKDIKVDKEKVKIQGDKKQVIAKVEPPREEKEEELAVEEEVSEEKEAEAAEGEVAEEKGQEVEKGEKVEEKAS